MGVSRRGGADVAGFEAVGSGFGGGGEADAVLEGDGVDPVTLLQMKNSQHQISDNRIRGRISCGRRR